MAENKVKCLLLPLCVCETALGSRGVSWPLSLENDWKDKLLPQKPEGSTLLRLLKAGDCLSKGGSQLQTKVSG